MDLGDDLTDPVQYGRLTWFLLFTMSPQYRQSTLHCRTVTGKESSVFGEINCRSEVLQNLASQETTCKTSFGGE